MDENNLQCEFSPLLTYTMKVNKNSIPLDLEEQQSTINENEERKYHFKYSIC